MPRFRSLRRPTRTEVAVAAMALLLGVLAVLQYNWAGKLSSDERERLRRHLDRQAHEFTDDFNRELTRIYFRLQWGDEIRPDAPLESDVDRYAHWFAAAQRPELIKALYRVSEPQAEGDPWVVERYERDPSRLVPVPAPAELAPILERAQRARVWRQERNGPPVRIEPAWADIPALVVPTMAAVDEPGRGSVFAPTAAYTVALLDEQILKTDLLPQLVERHFALSQDPTVHVGVYGERFAFTPAGAVPPPALRTSPDVSDDDLFQIRFSDFRRFVRVRGPNEPAAGAARQGPSPNPPPGGGPAVVIARDGRASVNVFRGGGPGGPGGDSNAPRWRVHVLHRAGSLDAVVANLRMRNLLISFGVLVLLGASMGMVLVTTGRARRLAAQQMEFVAGVSHELRTPLAVIRSAAENLADGVVADPKQVKRYGDVIAGEGRRLTEMVEQIMAFAGFESGRATLDVQPAELGAIVEDALRAAEPQVRDHHAVVDRRGADALPMVLVDRAAVSRSLQNLLVNALKYGGSPPRVVVEARGAEGGRREATVTVTDNGSGISARDLPHIFEPFYRGGDATARQIHGSGLGLSLVKRIMDQIGGRVTVRTEAGKGSAFTLHLPLAPAPARESHPDPAGLPDPRATTT